jgi:hypothetical protein
VRYINRGPCIVNSFVIFRPKCQHRFTDMGRKQRLAAEAAAAEAAAAAAKAAEEAAAIEAAKPREPTPGSGYTLVVDDVRRSLSPEYKREKSPFELGEKRNLQCASAKAIIDKALVMDITGGVTNVDEYISLFFTDSCVIDRAVLSDVSSPNVKIIVVDEDDEEAMARAAEMMAAKAASEGPQDGSQDEKKLRLKIWRQAQNLLNRDSQGTGSIKWLTGLQLVTRPQVSLWT